MKKILAAILLVSGVSAMAKPINDHICKSTGDSGLTVKMHNMVFDEEKQEIKVDYLVSEVSKKDRVYLSRIKLTDIGESRVEAFVGLSADSKVSSDKTTKAISLVVAEDGKNGLFMENGNVYKVLCTEVED